MVQPTRPTAEAGLPDFAPYGIESHWLKPTPARRTLLIVYAHPDDESFGNAGTIARYAAAGVAVHYVCATRGDVGVVAPRFLEQYPDIAALRTAELMCAARTLGLAGVHLLGYRDSGMVGSSDNQHPDSLHRAPLERVTGQVGATIRALRPQVVVTFGSYGGYGHPDHIKIHQATRAAFAAAGDPGQYPEQMAAGFAPWTPAKLYYSTFPTHMLRLSIAIMRLTRKDPRRMGENKDIDFVRAMQETTPATTLIDSRAFMEQRERAWLCHQSQLGGMGPLRRLPAVVRRLFMGPERFTRVIPAWNGGRIMERDLFAGVEGA